LFTAVCPVTQMAFVHVRYNATVGRRCGAGYSLIDSYTTCVTAANWTNTLTVNALPYNSVPIYLAAGAQLPYGCIKQKNYVGSNYQVRRAVSLDTPRQNTVLAEPLMSYT
jgi:hypothetical protein